MKDNEPLVLPTKDLGSCEIYPQSLQHSANGRFVSVCGDGEYIIYTALAWRNKAFGQALDFTWGSKDNSNDYAIRESSTSVKIFKNFKEKPGGLDVGFAAEGLMGGVLLSVRGSGVVGLFDWDSGAMVRRIDVVPNNVSIPAPLCLQSRAKIFIGNCCRFTGQKAESLSHLLVTTPSMYYGSTEMNIPLRFKLEPLRTMELKQPLSL